MNRFSNYRLCRNILTSCARKITDGSPQFHLDFVKDHSSYFQSRICDSIFEQLSRDMGQYNDMPIETVIAQMKVYLREYRLFANVDFDNNFLRFGLSPEFVDLYFDQLTKNKDWPVVSSKLKSVFDINEEHMEMDHGEAAIFIEDGKNEGARSLYFRFFKNICRAIDIQICASKESPAFSAGQIETSQILANLTKLTNQAIKYQKSNDGLYVCTSRGKTRLSEGILEFISQRTLQRKANPRSRLHLFYPASLDKDIFDLKRTFQGEELVNEVSFHNIGDCFNKDRLQKNDLSFREYFKAMFAVLYFNTLSKVKFFDRASAEQLILNEKVLDLLESIAEGSKTDPIQSTTTIWTAETERDPKIRTFKVILLKSKDTLDAFIITGDEMYLRTFLRLVLEAGEAYLGIRDFLNSSERLTFEKALHEHIISPFVK
jgi:hypothetical protein